MSIRNMLHSLIARETHKCVGCGAQHRNRNASDNSFSAFCTDACHVRTMQDIVTLDNCRSCGQQFEPHYGMDYTCHDCKLAIAAEEPITSWSRPRPGIDDIPF